MDVSLDLRDGGLLQEGASFQHEVATLLPGLGEGSLQRLLRLEPLERRRVLRLVEVGLVAVLEDHDWRVCAEGDQDRGLDVDGVACSSSFLLDRHGTSLLERHGERRVDVSNSM
jgi:hypothetical protein